MGCLLRRWFFGYASSDLFPDRNKIRERSSYTISLADTQGVENLNTQDAETSDRKSDPIADYRSTLQLLKKYSYGTNVDAKKTRQLTYEAIRGMLASLQDPFTSFLDPDDWAQMQSTTKGDFEGIGALLQPSGHEVKIAEPIEGSPAEKVGLQSDDIVVKVDGESVVGKNINEVVKRIKGKPGTKVKLGILRRKEVLTFVITRANVIPPVVKHEMIDKDRKIGYIFLKEFNERSTEQLNTAFESLKKQGMKALVFDLRGNPGGLLDTAIQVASTFIPRNSKEELKNVVVFTREGSGQESRRTLRGDAYQLDGIPFVVLVNEGSASASEIVSGAIKDYGVGTIIGERTYGKGRVQSLFPLGDASALRLTTALYFPPSHNDINFKHDEDGVRIPNTGGILPDIEVKQANNWKGFKDKANDKQLQSGIEFLRSKQ